MTPNIKWLRMQLTLSAMEQIHYRWLIQPYKLKHPKALPLF